MNSIKLVKFKKDDALFIKENFPTYYMDNSIENIQRIIIDRSKPDDLFYCITFEGFKVGIISLKENKEKKLSWGIMIKNDFREKGIATTAFDLIKAMAKEQGYSTIISSCLKSNIASKKLHEKVGFKLIKEEQNSAGKEMLRWEMSI